MNLCHVCDKAFSCKGNMTRHLAEAHEAPGYACDDCGLTFRRKDYLKNHIITKACGHTTLKQGALLNKCSSTEDSIGGRSAQQLGQGYGFESVPSETVDQESSNGAQPNVQLGDGFQGVSSESEDQESSAEEETSGGETAQDVMDHEMTDDINSENSSDDSDECGPTSDEDESSSANESSCEDLVPSGAEDTVQGENEDTVQGEDDDPGQGEEEDMVQNESGPDDEIVKHSNFARWRNEDNGLYVTWKSRNRIPFLVQNRAWLEKLRHPPFHSQKQLIAEATYSQLDTFREMALNVLIGHVAMPALSLRNFKKRVHALRILASEHTSYNRLRRTLLRERVGVLPFLLLRAVPTCIKSREVLFKGISV